MSQIVANLEFALEKQLSISQIPAADDVESNRQFQLFLQQDDEKENESSIIRTTGWKAFHMAKNVIFLGKICPGWKTCISYAKWAWSWLRGCFVKRKEAPVNPKTYHDVSLPTEADTDIISIPRAREILSEPNFRIFSFSQLKQAKKNLSSDSYIGEGGFGKVYKGWLPKTGLIAIKIWNGDHIIQGLEEWKAEVNIHGALSHPNLVKVLGYCQNDKELLIVYEYMSKGSLYNHLFCRGTFMIQPLSWEIRLKILIGAARSLAFLHSSDKNIVFRDFKTSNILLDEDSLTRSVRYMLLELLQLK